MESYYQRNKDKWKAYYESHKVEISIRNKIQRAKNRKALITDNWRRNRELKIEVLTYYGGGKFVCAVCSESRFPCLSIDHLEGGGTQHRKELKLGGYNFYRWLRKNNYPEGYMTLCMNCQMVKREVKNECKREKFEEE